MKELREYAQLSEWTPKNSNHRKLYDMALSGFSRQEAREVFQISDNYFNVLYKEVKDQLADGVLTNNFRNWDRVKRIQFGIRKQYETAMMLIGTGKMAAGIPLARAAVRKAEKNGMYPIALELSRKLRRYYSTTAPDLKYYKYYTEKQWFYNQEVQWELEAEDVFFEFGLQLRKGTPSPLIPERLAELAEIPAKSNRFHHVRFLTAVLYYQVKRQEAKMLATCEAALQHFENINDLPYIIKFSFYFRAIASHLSRREFAQAETLINKSLIGPARGKHNWQIIMIHRALLGFHSRKPAIALDAWHKATKLPKKFQTEQVKERWQIVRAYLELYDIEMPGKWRLNRFMNSMPVSSSDKTGNHLSILIVEMLHLLKTKKYEHYRYRCERLEAYIKEHLKGKGLERPVAFLRLLQCIARGGFQIGHIHAKSKRYLQTISGSHPSIGADVREIEVVPFEELWRMAIGFLTPKT